MTIDLTSLEKAVEALQRAIRVSEDPALVESASEDLRNTVRAGVIQNFEFTYELCWKMLKRHLEAVAASPTEVDALSFRALIRAGAEKGIVGDPERWFDYRQQRNITSHTYDEDKARSVYRTALAFAPDAGELLARLKASDA